MGNMEIGYLRAQIDMEKKYVDFSVLRTALNIAVVAKDLGVKLSAPSYEGECRAKCPKCGKERSLSVNINTGRFYCFAKSCPFKGGGAIDLFSRLHEISAKEASHLLACGYGITPYGENTLPQNADGEKVPEIVVEKIEEPAQEKPAVAVSEDQSWVSKKDFKELESRFERLSNLLFGHLLECDRPNEFANDYDPPLTKSHAT
ncbi:MAG: hypothetical protein HOP17_12065 [Acidobacteria bacterium]|nr:hypothetical protein [Acidobacteriota bacterium]